MKKIFTFQLLLPALIFTSSLMAQKKDSLPPMVCSWDSLKAVQEESRVRKEIIEGSTTSLSYFEAHSSSLEPGKAPHPPHFHTNQEELIIIKEGQVRITIADQSRVLGAGSIAYAIPVDMHGIENAGTTQATYYIIKYESRLPLNAERGRLSGGSFMIDKKGLVDSSTGKGYRRDYCNRPTALLGKFEVHTTALNPGLDSHPPHRHVEEEVVLIIRGKVTMHIDGKDQKAGPGDLIFLPSGVLHGLTNTGKEQCEYFSIQWRN